MTRFASHRATTLLIGVLVLLLDLAGLAVAAGSDQRATAFSANVDPLSPVLVLRPGQTVCQGPIPVPHPFAAVTVWQFAPPPTETVLVSVRAGGRTSAPAPLRLTPGEVERGARTARADLPLTVARGPVDLCLRSIGATVGFAGAGAGPASGVLPRSAAGPEAISAVFETARPRTLLASLPTVLRRATLLTPGGWGSAAEWALLGLLLAAAGWTLVALARAADEEAEAD